MKKILAIALAVVFMFALAIPAFAETYDITAAHDATLSPSEDDVTVTYNVGGHYIVTIPSSIDANTQSTAKVQASSVLIPKGKELVVTVTAEDDVFTLEYTGTGATADDAIPYSINISGNPISSGDEVLVINKDGKNTGSGAAGGEVELAFVITSNAAKYQGSYTDTLTFAVEVK